MILGRASVIKGGIWVVAGFTIGNTSVFPHGGIHRRHEVAGVHRVVIGIGGGATFHVNIYRSLDVFIDCDVIVHSYRKAVIILIGIKAVVHVISDGSRGAYHARTSGNTEIMRLTVGMTLQKQSPPVGVGITVWILCVQGGVIVDNRRYVGGEMVRTVAGIVPPQFVCHGHETRHVHIVWLSCRFLITVFIRILQRHLTVRSTLCRYKDYAGSSARTVYRGGCGILQHCYILNVLRVDVVDIVSRHTVYDYQRVAVADCGDTAYLYIRAGARVASRTRHLHT